MKLRQTPERAEQRAIARRIVDREYDQALRMWMPYDTGFLLFSRTCGTWRPAFCAAPIGYGSPTIARLWLDK